LVCAPSNKAVQVLAERFVSEHPDNKKVIFVGIESKVPNALRPIFLHTWLSYCRSLLIESITNMLRLSSSESEYIEDINKAAADAKLARAKISTYFPEIDKSKHENLRSCFKFLYKEANSENCTPRCTNERVLKINREVTHYRDEILAALPSPDDIEKTLLDR